MHSKEDRPYGLAILARALAESGMVGVQVLSAESAERALTEPRKKLIRLLRDEDVSSGGDLAELAGRDQQEVSDDLGILAEYGIIRYDEEDNEKRLYLAQEHIVAAPSNLFEEYPVLGQVYDEHGYPKLVEVFKYVREQREGEVTIRGIVDLADLPYETVMGLIEVFEDIHELDESAGVKTYTPEDLDDEVGSLAENLGLEEDQE